MANCFWDDYEGHKKMQLANWYLICMRKQYGGSMCSRYKGFEFMFTGLMGENIF
jgi:hypothetical protein